MQTIFSVDETEALYPRSATKQCNQTDTIYIFTHVFIYTFYFISIERKIKFIDKFRDGIDPEPSEHGSELLNHPLLHWHVALLIKTILKIIPIREDHLLQCLASNCLAKLVAWLISWLRSQKHGSPSSPVGSMQGCS